MDFCLKRRGNVAVKGLCDAAGNAGKGVRIAAERDCRADGVLKVG